MGSLDECEGCGLDIDSCVCDRVRDYLSEDDTCPGCGNDLDDCVCRLVKHYAKHGTPTEFDTTPWYKELATSVLQFAGVYLLICLPLLVLGVVFLYLFVLDHYALYVLGFVLFCWAIEELTRWRRGRTKRPSGTKDN